MSGVTDSLSRKKLSRSRDGIVGEGQASFRAALAAGHDGVVGTRLTSLYVSGQSSAAWRARHLQAGHEPGPAVRWWERKNLGHGRLMLGVARGRPVHARLPR